jgi:antitoxin FitA
MATMIQIRNVPSDLHRELKARAALEGMTLSNYLLREIRHVAERPTLAEMARRLAKLTPVRTPIDSAALIRAERDSR